MTYNLTLLENVTSPEVVVTAVNTYTDGVLGPLILASIFFLIFSLWSSRGLEIDQNLTYSSFITSLFGLLLWALTIITWQVAIIPVILTFATFIINKFRS